MRKVTYQGPHDAVDIPSLGLTVAAGETIEVDDAVAKVLEAQGWKASGAKPKAKASSEGGREA